ncbi:GNAT family N-acetyltransferase [Lentilactobacillus sp. Marseille-Q4993]|uniref:GNAT family N-acetyltransferase n=1 Tax=Lentilactobacillus sp. Marseille-Q4993 TaxID=3039492 RepID=UPI0024BD14FD|nr:GNAT family N-acetyltransferase [Lentilactobacillus sp. Marseille-Q4993]
MSTFEKYHPVLTPHYQLDWLTQTPVKEIFALYQNEHIETSLTLAKPTEILDTVRNVNHTMQAVMSEEELTWGITDKDTNEFVGIIKIYNLKSETKTAKISFVLRHDESDVLVYEVLKRAIKFVIDHFDTETIEISLHQKDAIIPTVLNELKFNQTSADTYQLNLADVTSDYEE